MATDWKTDHEDIDLKASIRYETLSTLARFGRASFMFSIINALLAYYVLRDIAEPIILNIWLASLVATICIRMFLVALFWRLDKQGQRYSFWITLYLICIYLAGICWGIFPLLNFFQSTDWSETFIVFLIAGMSAGGMTSLYPLLVAAIPYQIFILMPLIITLGSSEQPSQIAMGIFAGLYLIFLIRTSYLLNHSVKRTIRLEIENETLFDFLSTANRNPQTGEISGEAVMQTSRGYLLNRGKSND